jgi:hypothetical protein
MGRNPEKMQKLEGTAASLKRNEKVIILISLESVENRPNF